MTKAERLEEAKRLTSNEFQKVLQTDPAVPVKLADGNTYTVEFTFGAVKKVFRETGKNINIGQLTGQDLADPDLLSAVLLCGLQNHSQMQKGQRPENEVFTGMDVDTFQTEFMYMRHFSGYTHAVMEAIQAVLPDMEYINKVFEDATKDEEKIGDIPLVEPPVTIS